MFKKMRDLEDLKTALRNTAYFILEDVNDDSFTNEDKKKMFREATAAFNGFVAAANTYGKDESPDSEELERLYLEVREAYDARRKVI